MPDSLTGNAVPTQATSRTANAGRGIPRLSAAAISSHAPSMAAQSTKSKNSSKSQATNHRPSHIDISDAHPLTGQAARRSTLASNRMADPSTYSASRGDGAGEVLLSQRRFQVDLRHFPPLMPTRHVEIIALEFLAAARYSAPMTTKTLTSPTAKEFQSIFRFLVDDILGTGTTWIKKFEDDANLILKDLRYPSMDLVSKTALLAPGSPQSWPGLLAMLNWLVELCRAHENWHDTRCVTDPIFMSYDELPVDQPNIEDRLLWIFAFKTYQQWFNGAIEEFSDLEQELEEIYARLMSDTRKETENLESRLQRTEVELNQLLVQEPPLRKIEDEYVQLMSDKTKFIAFIDLHRQKADRSRQAILNIRAGIVTQEQELETQRAELARLERAVNAQNLSPDEINRMSNERDTLTRYLDELRAKIIEVSQTAYDQEMTVTKSMDRFETLQSEYLALGHQIGLPSARINAPPGDADTVDYDLDLDLGVEDVGSLQMTGTRMRSSIWQGLQSQRELARQYVSALSNEIISLEDEYDRVEQQSERQREEVGNMEVKLRMAHDKADTAQSNLGAENTDTNKIIAQLESEVTNMLAASQQGVLATQSQLESTKIAFKEMKHKVALLQDELIGQVSGQIGVIIKTKEHAASSLGSIRAMAESH
ncbi:hypothetical protein I316_00737 [Kwoniella heveanensis BCC8398]|uniref:Kinetochore protein NDC80 n=1 Tax=Kwoniella heveanensis BCC8398 TaxID=1296120 RepID=A0A1B9H2X6_9TREE|nr:hypothetical protein I316_00737 [Kwoniella heveanensis BCC8398]